MFPDGRSGHDPLKRNDPEEALDLRRVDVGHEDVAFLQYHGRHDRCV